MNFEEQERYLEHRAKERASEALKKGDNRLSEEETYSEVTSILQNVDEILGNEEISEESELKIDKSDQQLQDSLIEEMEDIKKEIGEDELGQLSKESQERLNSFLFKKFLPLKRAQRKLADKIPQLIQKVYKDKQLKEDVIVWRKITKLEEEASKVNEAIDRISNQSPEAFLSNGLLKLRKYKRDFEQYGLIETPEIGKIYNKIMNDVRRKLENRNGVVALTGGTGTGKTVLARKLAEKFSKDGKYECVSAYSKMTPDDLISRLGIVPESVNPEEVPQKIEEAFENYKKGHSEVTTEELQEVENTIKEVVEGQAKQKTMSTKEVLEAVGRAAEKGVKVVIDEFNYLSSETLGALNHLLSGTNVKEGFGFILTGNIGKEFLQRKDLDPAFINRILEGTVKYDYPPQEFDKSLKDSILDREEYLSGKEAPARDLYLSGLTQLIDKKGNLIAPKNALEKLWDLSEAFSLIQQISQGKNIRNLLGNQEGFQELGESSFKKIFLSFRNFNSVVRSWKLDGYSKSVDYYIFDSIIRPAEIFASKEAAQLFYFFKFKGFLNGKEFDDITVDTSQWKIKGIPQVIDEKKFKLSDEEKKIKAFTPQEVVEAGFGVAMLTYDEVSLGQDDIDNRKRKGSMEEFMDEYESWFSGKIKEVDFEGEKIEELCLD